MFDMSWGEVLTIGAVALLVIGPKDLPRTLRAFGQMTGKVRRMAGEFQSQFHDAMREADMEGVKTTFTDAHSTFNKAANPLDTLRNELKASIEAPLAARDVYGPVDDPLHRLKVPDLPAPDLPIISEPVAVPAESSSSLLSSAESPQKGGRA
jgi:sec-independent protein translocase protein TatB